MHNCMIPLQYFWNGHINFLSLSVFLYLQQLGFRLSVKDMRGVPDIAERKDFYEMTGFIEYALKATKDHSMTMAALTGQQIVYASKLNSQYVIMIYIHNLLTKINFIYLLDMQIFTEIGLSTRDNCPNLLSRHMIVCRQRWQDFQGSIPRCYVYVWLLS